MNWINCLPGKLNFPNCKKMSLGSDTFLQLHKIKGECKTFSLFKYCLNLKFIMPVQLHL